MSELFGAMTISANGMKAQGERVRVISENVANAATAPLSPEQEPYRRKLITFKNVMDKSQGINLVEVDSIKEDRKSDFVKKYMPHHPGAGENGYVNMPNINTLIEMTDMKEAQRSYEANLGMIQKTKTMAMSTIDLLRN